MVSSDEEKKNLKKNYEKKKDIILKKLEEMKSVHVVQGKNLNFVMEIYEV